MMHLETSESLVEEQNGFRRGRSCLHHIFILQTLVRNKCQTGNLFAAFIDFTKAFDSLNQEMLFHLLANSGVTDKLLNMIKQMYSNTVNIVRINGYLTDELVSEIGSKQGDPSSPTHFNVYINPLFDALNSSGLGVKLGPGTTVCTLAYADDVVIFVETQEALQKLLKIVGDWSENWRLHVNPKKTNVVHFRPKGVCETQASFTIGEHCIQFASRYKYLGVTLDCYGQVEPMVEQLAGAASRALGAVIGKTCGNYDLGYQSYSRLFNSCVSPVLDYACGSWNVSTAPSLLLKLDHVQLRAGHFYCGLPKNAANMGVVGEMGWSPGVVRRDLEALRLYNQLVGMSENRLPLLVMKYDREQQRSWSNNIFGIMKAIYHEENWSELQPVNLKYAKSVLMDMYTKAWKLESSQKSKLETFVP